MTTEAAPIQETAEPRELPLDFVRWFMDRHDRQPAPTVAAYPDGEAWLIWQAARASAPTVNARKAADEIVRKARAAVLDSAIGGAWGTGLYNDSAAAQVFMDCFSEWADQHLAALILSHTGSPAAGLTDFAALLQRQMDWSSATFGPGPRSAGNIDHIRRELREIEAAPADLEEWIDVAMLAIDGAMREGHSPEAVLRGYAEKLEKNFARSWPDWRTADPTKAIEHDRLIQAQVGK